MVSLAAGWKEGQKVWSVTHDAQRGREDLRTEGALPAAFAAIRDRLRAEQQAAGGSKADVDYIFDVPVELARMLTGYRHDEDLPEAGADPFEVLVEISSIASASTRKPSFLKRLFGG